SVLRCRRMPPTTAYTALEFRSAACFALATRVRCVANPAPGTLTVVSLPPPPPASPPPPPVGDPSPATAFRQADERRWGLGEVWIGLALSQVAAGVLALVAVSAGGWDTVSDAPLWITGLLSLALEGTLLAVAVWASVTKGRGPRRDYRISVTVTDPAVGITAGVLAQLVLVPAITVPILWLTNTDADEVSKTATELADRATTPFGVITLVVAVGAIAPVVEEIFFAGLMFGPFAKGPNLRWLEQILPESIAPDTTSSRWNVGAAFVLSSLIFGAIHFQLILLAPLSAVGALFAWLAHRSRRLGPAIWAHMAFNITTLVNLLLL
ncbi:MAG: lysostaphin resistance A-like protein, partial [Acidimicrobiales bacterium]